LEKIKNWKKKIKKENAAEKKTERFTISTTECIIVNVQQEEKNHSAY